MPKVRLTKIAEENDFSFDLAFKIAKENLKDSMLTGKGKGTWVSEEGQAILDPLLLAEELCPKEYKGRVVRLAPNKSYVYAYIWELEETVPCVVPRNRQRSLHGKVIDIEEIKDVSGSTFRQIKKCIYSDNEPR